MCVCVGMSRYLCACLYMHVSVWLCVGEGGDPGVCLHICLNIGVCSCVALYAHLGISDHALAGVFRDPHAHGHGICKLVQIVEMKLCACACMHEEACGYVCVCSLLLVQGLGASRCVWALG